MSPNSVTPDFLAKLSLFSDIPPDLLEKLAAISHIRTMQDGDEIFHEGDPRDFLYIVLEGRIALEMHIPNRGRLRILTVEPQEVVGWSSVTDIAMNRTVTARAVCAGQVLAIDAANLHRACQEDPKLGFVIMHHVANVIASRLLITRMQLLDMFANPDSEASNG